MDSQLDIKFHKAFEDISKLKEVLPPDTMLKLYAFYKQGISGDSFKINAGPDVRDAFKFNAWMQLNGMSQEEAKKEYIKLAKSILKTTQNTTL